MKIKIEKYNDGKTFRADMLDLPGSPPVGQGETETEAVANLFMKIIFQSTDGRFINRGCIPESWLRYVTPDKIVIERGE